MAAVLVIDDNEMSRFAIRSVLEHGGYTVYEADSSAAAERMCEEHPGEIDAIIADAVLRGDAGQEAARRIRERCPTMVVLYISGYPLDHLVNRGLLRADNVDRPGAGFLQKPFQATVLLNAVRDLLAGGAAPAVRQPA